MTVRVLVVDDEPDVEALFRQQFRREIREGLYKLDFALSALAALAVLDDAIGEKIILLVSDINMSGMSGIDLIPEVKVRRPDLPVFMISTYGDPNTVATALTRGADGFLTKPVDFTKLKQDIIAVMTDATGKRMTSSPDDTTTDTSAIIAALRTERDAALAREAVLAEALTQRNSEYGERIEQQSATMPTGKAEARVGMSSPCNKAFRFSASSVTCMPTTS